MAQQLSFATALQPTDSRVPALLPTLTHELRGPLNAVLGFTQLLRQQPNAPAEVRARYLSHIEASALHLKVVIDDIGASTEPAGRSTYIERLCVGDVAADAAAMIEPARHLAGVALGIQAAPLAWVKADRCRLRQILLNLLSNAIKYDRRGRRVRITWRRQGDHLRLSVTDAGGGLRADQVRRLFQPFDRLGAEDTCVPGTGIGLAISRDLARQMSGDIKVRSEIGKGCTFTVILPRTDSTT